MIDEFILNCRQFVLETNKGKLKSHEDYFQKLRTSDNALALYFSVLNSVPSLEWGSSPETILASQSICCLARKGCLSDVDTMHLVDLVSRNLVTLSRESFLHIAISLWLATARIDKFASLLSVMSRRDAVLVLSLVTECEDGVVKHAESHECVAAYLSPSRDEISDEDIKCASLWIPLVSNESALMVWIGCPILQLSFEVICGIGFHSLNRILACSQYLSYLLIASSKLKYRIYLDIVGILTRFKRLTESLMLHPSLGRNTSGRCLAVLESIFDAADFLHIYDGVEGFNYRMIFFEIISTSLSGLTAIDASLQCYCEFCADTCDCDEDRSNRCPSSCICRKKYYLQLASMSIGLAGKIFNIDAHEYLVHLRVLIKFCIATSAIIDSDNASEGTSLQNSDLCDSIDDFRRSFRDHLRDMCAVSGALVSWLTTNTSDTISFFIHATASSSSDSNSNNNSRNSNRCSSSSSDNGLSPWAVCETNLHACSSISKSIVDNCQLIDCLQLVNLLSSEAVIECRPLCRMAVIILGDLLPGLLANCGKAGDDALATQVLYYGLKSMVYSLCHAEVAIAIQSPSSEHSYWLPFRVKQDHIGCVALSKLLRSLNISLADYFSCPLCPLIADLTSTHHWLFGFIQSIFPIYSSLHHQQQQRQWPDIARVCADIVSCLFSFYFAYLSSQSTGLTMKSFAIVQDAIAAHLSNCSVYQHNALYAVALLLLPISSAIAHSIAIDTANNSSNENAAMIVMETLRREWLIVSSVSAIDANAAMEISASICSSIAAAAHPTNVLFNLLNSALEEVATQWAKDVSSRRDVAASFSLRLVDCMLLFGELIVFLCGENDVLPVEFHEFVRLLCVLLRIGATNIINDNHSDTNAIATQCSNDIDTNIVSGLLNRLGRICDWLIQSNLRTTILNKSDSESFASLRVCSSFVESLVSIRGVSSSHDVEVLCRLTLRLPLLLLRLLLSPKAISPQSLSMVETIQRADWAAIFAAINDVNSSRSRSSSSCSDFFSIVSWNEWMRCFADFWISNFRVTDLCHHGLPSFLGIYGRDNVSNILQILLVHCSSGDDDNTAAKYVSTWESVVLLTSTLLGNLPMNDNKFLLKRNDGSIDQNLINSVVATEGPSSATDQLIELFLSNNGASMTALSAILFFCLCKAPSSLCNTIIVDGFIKLHLVVGTQLAHHCISSGLYRFMQSRKISKGDDDSDHLVVQCSSFASGCCSDAVSSFGWKKLKKRLKTLMRTKLM